MKARLALSKHAAALSLLLLLGAGVSLAGCGRLEVGVEPTPTGAPSPSIIPTDRLALFPTAVPTPLPTQVPTVATPKATVPTQVPTAATPQETVPTQVPTALPTTTPAVTPLLCDNVPVRGFGKVWAEHAEVKQGLGCPSYYYYCYGGNCSGEQAMVSAVQRFEHGTMIWVNRPTWENTQWVYVLFGDGTYQRFVDTFRDGDPESDPTIVPPAGLYQPIRGFGKVWREGTGAQVRERLGWAIEPEQGGDGAWQDFERGLMFWIGPVDRIYVLYAYDLNWNPIRTYQEFQDTF